MIDRWLAIGGISKLKEKSLAAYSISIKNSYKFFKLILWYFYKEKQLNLENKERKKEKEREKKKRNLRKKKKAKA